MAWNGSGVFSRTNGTHTGSTTWVQDRVAGDYILAARHDTHDEDLATGNGACLTKNNETKPTATFAPNANESYDIGTTSLKWRDFHFSRNGLIGGTLGVTGKLTASAGLRIGGDWSLGVADAFGVMTYASTVTRCFIGDGTGYSWRFSKRASSATTDLVTITDAGAMSTASAINNLASVSLTGRAANIGSTTLYAVPAGESGFYRVYVYISITTVDAVSSTLPLTQIGWTNPISSATQAENATATSTANTTLFQDNAMVVVYAKESTNITYTTTSYASNTPGAMAYHLHIRVEKMFA